MLEYIVILPQEEEDGLSFREEKMEVLISLTETGWSMRMALAAFMENFGWG